MMAVNSRATRQPEIQRPAAPYPQHRRRRHQGISRLDPRHVSPATNGRSAWPPPRSAPRSHGLAPGPCGRTGLPSQQSPWMRLTPDGSPSRRSRMTSCRLPNRRRSTSSTKLSVRRTAGPALSRQISIGDFRRRIRPSALVIREQKQRSSSLPGCASTQYRIYSDNACGGARQCRHRDPSSPPPLSSAATFHWRVLAECCLILFEAKAAQPTSNVHDDAPLRPRLA
jgi:hypothetical protein